MRCDLWFSRSQVSGKKQELIQRLQALRKTWCQVAKAMSIGEMHNGIAIHDHIRYERYVIERFAREKKVCMSRPMFFCHRFRDFFFGQGKDGAAGV